MRGIILLAALVPALASAQQTMLSAMTFLTSTTTGFGTFIEGAAVDATGAIYAVNFGNNTALATIGKVENNALFFSLANPGTSAFNGIRFSSTGVVYVADKNGRRVLAGAPADLANAKSICQDPRMLVGVPNDIAMTTGARWLFLSGMNYTANTTVKDGQVWACDTTTGTATLLKEMGRTNGIEVSPDNTALYVSEAFNLNFNVISNVIWKFTLNPTTGTISNQQLFANFSSLDNSAAVDVDGMRTDIMGNLYVARNGGGEVAKFDPAGNLLAKIKVSTMFPTNLEFGGPTGTTLFVVGRCGNANFGEGVGCVDTFQNDIPGRAFTELQMGQLPPPPATPPPTTPPPACVPSPNASPVAGTGNNMQGSATLPTTTKAKKPKRTKRPMTTTVAQ
ncbi:calcium-dependent phosphotriesterase [Gonapodya prolifera JEL478]|uniref:Calcium-dependent phosphotriesterase n=1 Tax=Gonapodya prolifera (strain JEL478) TaxID=1344416 RepID=A0A139AUE0_GONPJ|nr:calcium-dependent phosphotriesterase [Gonapodya prolifera JEL478]|eukprot:KXS20324.1 calcium-dependent phosphotriesterase [Gonapodya prolifera JEL478]